MDKAVAVFDVHKFERPVFEAINREFRMNLRFFEARLTPETAALSENFDVVCSFVNDRLNSETIERLKVNGVKLIALRSAGFNHVDLAACAKAEIRVVRVPAYSPHAVAEFAVALMMALNRKTHRAYARVKEHNFSLDGLVGFDFNGKTVGVVGTGRIGRVAARIMNGFGCHVLGHDLTRDSELPFVEYVALDELLRRSDIVTLHVPLNRETKHLLNERALSIMKPGAMLINTGRGGLIDTQALIAALKAGRLGSAGLDVYEEEEEVFYQDLSELVLQDDTLARLLTFPNVVVTSHQGFLTREALENIVRTTLSSIEAFRHGRPLQNEIKP